MRRFSIAALMTVVFVTAVAVAALRQASDTWAGVLILITLLLLATALVGTIHRRGVKRAFWQGFALFGWGYWALTFGPWFSEQIQPKLPTTALLDFAHGKIDPAPSSDPFVATTGVSLLDPTTQFQVYSSQPASPPPIVASAAAPLIGTGAPPVPGAVTFVMASSNRDQFQRVGHCLFTLLAALLGGGLACWFQRSNRDA